MLVVVGLVLMSRMTYAQSFTPVGDWVNDNGAVIKINDDLTGIYNHPDCPSVFTLSITSQSTTGFDARLSWNGGNECEGFTVSLAYKSCTVASGIFTNDTGGGGTERWTRPEGSSSCRDEPPPPLVCAVGPLPPVTGAAIPFEEWATNNFGPLPSSITSPAILRKLDQAALQMEVFPFTIARTSGYRPYEYQQHFWEIKTRWDRMIGLSADDFALCSERWEEVFLEKIRHNLITHDASDLRLAVNPPDTSLHVPSPARALDYATRTLTDQQLKSFDAAAFKAGLHRPCGPNDIVHFTLLEDQECDSIVSSESHSPVAIMVTDPLGRRVGFDPATGHTINEIGSNAWFSGIDSEPQEVIIGDAVPGTYRTTGFGTGEGPFRVETSRKTADGDMLESQSATGDARPGLTLSLEIAVRVAATSFIGSGGGPIASINPGNNGSVAVSIITDDTIDAATIDQATLRFGATGAEQSLRRCSLADAGGDARVDLVCQFATPLTGLQSGDSYATLRGKTRSGQPFETVFPIRTMPVQR
jgi:hypothetical protein